MAGAVSRRVLRSFLASLLESELTWKELDQFGDDLGDDDTVKTFQEAVYRLAATLQMVDMPRPPAPPPPPPSDDRVSLLLDLVQRKRLPKAEIVGRMNSIAPNLPLPKSALNRTMRELVEWYVRANSNKVNELIQGLGGETLDDDYLKGIINRNKG